MLIGLGGEIGSGKSTVASILTKKYGYHEKFFARNLKEMFKAVYNVSDWAVATQEGKAHPLTYPLPLSAFHLNCICHWVATVNKVKLPDNIDLLIHVEAEKKITFPTTRKGLQYIGTDICRKWFGDDFHVRIVFEEIEREGLPLDKVVISDARFANERQVISSKSGKNILIVNPEDEKPKDASVSGHASETSLGTPEEYDYVLMNYKESLVALEATVDAAVKFVSLGN